MNMRNDLSIGGNESFSDIYYSAVETVQNVKENFDLRRYHSAEGKSIDINGVTERCLVQLPSNPLRELNDYRKIQCPVTADVKRGYYVNYENTIWIIDTNVANVDDAYLSARMSRCQYLLRWQNKNGYIIERWAYSSDQTKYSNGEFGNKAVTVGDNQYALLLPIDEETKLLKRNMRFAMDFEDSDEPDIYKLSNRKVNLNNETYFDRGGTMTITLSFDSLNKNNDKQVVLNDGRKVWICDYNVSTTLPPPDEIGDLTAHISGNNCMKLGIPKSFSVSFMDKDKRQLDWETVNFKWNVVSDFNIVQNIIGNKIELTVEDENYIDSSFLLQVVVDEKVISENSILVVSLV